MELDVRGTPAWQIRTYLERLGGTLQPDGSYQGPGWRVSLVEGEYAVFGTVHPRVVFTIEGERARELEAALRLRVMRVGG